MSAPDLFDHVLRRGDVAERLRHFAPVLVEHEAVGEHDVERRAAARAAAFQQRGLKPAAMLVGAFEIHHRLVAAVGLALECRRGRESARGSSSTKACVEPESNQTSRMSSTFCQPSLASLPRKRSRAPGCVPGVGALLLEGLDDADIDLGIVEDVDRAVRLLLDEHRDRHAPGALARDHPVGPALDHAVDAVLALPPAPSASPRSQSSARWRSVSPMRLSMSLSIAMNHCGVLRKMTGFFERHECGY